MGCGRAPGGGRAPFIPKQLPEETTLKPVFDKGLSGSGIFTMVPRNCTIVMQLDGLAKDEVPHLELATGEPLIYDLNQNGTVMNKEIRALSDPEAAHG